MHTWVASLLRCPYCMSRLEFEQTGLYCTCCLRSYPVANSGDSAAVLLLKRGDRLATLPQDLVVHRETDLPQADYRARVSRVMRRERFLSGLTVSSEQAGGSAALDEDSHAMLDLLIAALPASGIVLDVDGSAWAGPLVAHGFRVIVIKDTLSPHRSIPPTGTSIATVEANALEMPFAAASVDGVCCATGFEHIRADRRAVLFRQIHRVLRPHGMLYMTAPTEPLDTMLRRYLHWRVLKRRPLCLGEEITPPLSAHSRRRGYQALITAHALDALCRDHGLQVHTLRRKQDSWLLLAQKVQ